MVGARILVTPDGQEIDTRQLGFTVSPHEECAVEEAVRIVERLGGSVSVLTLGPSEASEQLRDAAAIGATHLVHLKTDGREWDPIVTAQAIVEVVHQLEVGRGVYDLILFGNEAPDTGDYQVGIRVAHSLQRPCVTGVKNLEVTEQSALARREFRGIGALGRAAEQEDRDEEEQRHGSGRLLGRPSWTPGQTGTTSVVLWGV